MASVYTFKDGKYMYKHIIAYANGDFVSLKDYEILKDEFNKLKSELFDAQKSADEYYNKCIDLTNQIEKLKSELETKVNFETDRLVKLPFNPLETANMLINAKYKDKIPLLEREVDRNIYDTNDLEQIAEHLLVYCKHNNECEE